MTSLFFTIVFLILGMLVGFLVTMFISWFKKGFSRKFFESQAWRGAIRVFLAYWLVAIIFALVYWLLYISNYENFVFNADVALTKNKELQIEAKAQLEEAAKKAHVGKVSRDTINATSNLDSLKRAQLKIINSLSNRLLHTMRVRIDSANYSKRKEFKKRVEAANGQHIPVEAFGKLFHLTDTTQIMRLFDSVSDDARDQLLTSYLKSYKQLSDTFHPVIPQRINIKEYTLAYIIGSDTINISDTNQIAIKALDYFRLAQEQRILIPWTFFDFLYFSAGSLTGGAFGDIIPNSTLIKSFFMCKNIEGHLGRQLIRDVVV